MCRHSLGYVSNAVQENNMTNRQQCSAPAGWLVSLSQIEYAKLNRYQISELGVVKQKSIVYFINPR
jgi:hypothetical protein